MSASSDHPSVAGERVDAPPRRRRFTERIAARRAERGATLVEYTLLVALLAVGTIGGLTLLQDSASDTAQSSADRISTHTIPPTSLP